MTILEDDWNRIGELLLALGDDQPVRLVHLNGEDRRHTVLIDSRLVGSAKMRSTPLILLILAVMAASPLVLPAIPVQEVEQGTSESQIAELRSELEQRLSPLEAELLTRVIAIEAQTRRTSWFEPQVVLPLALAMGGWFFAFWQIRENRRQKNHEILIDSLKYFEGGTQRRSIGISIVEAGWNEKQFRGRWLTVLVNQVVYLFSRKNNRDAPHERANLYRILEILERERQLLGDLEKSLLGEALWSYPMREDRGLVNLDMEKLELWKKSFPKESRIGG